MPLCVKHTNQFIDSTSKLLFNILTNMCKSPTIPPMYFVLEMLCISFFFIISFLFLFCFHVVYTLVNGVLLHQFNIGPVRSIFLFFNHTLTHTNWFFLLTKVYMCCLFCTMDTHFIVFTLVKYKHDNQMIIHTYHMVMYCCTETPVDCSFVLSKYSLFLFLNGDRH